MNYIGKFISNFKEAYNEINAATLTGAIDVVVVHQEDNSFTSSPFHVRFGKIGVLRSREKVVDIEINGEPVDIHMKLGDNGEAFFVEELQDWEELEEDPFLGTSPLPSYLDFGHREDDLKSQDSGVGAEEVICKSLKVRHQRDSQCITLEKLSQSLSRIESSVVDSVPVRFNVGNENVSSQCNTELDQPCAHRAERSLSLPSEVDCTSKVDAVEQTGDNDSQTTVFNLAKHKCAWKDSSFRSQSLTTELVFLKAENILTDVQGCKTDGEEATRGSRSNRRRRRKRLNEKRKRKGVTRESHSSDNSSTSEAADLSLLRVSGVATHDLNDPIFVMDDFENQGLNLIDTIDSGRIGNFPEGRNDRKSISVWPDFHPFSDTDISPPPSLNNSRSNTPVKSDTEYECQKQKIVRSDNSGDSKDNKWSWTWGQLPTPPTGQRSAPVSRQSFADPTNVNEGDAMSSDQVEDAERSMLSNMFNFMRATKKARHNPESEGIYLDDLNLDELEPEVAALYFPRNSSLLEKQKYTGFKSVAQDDDVESGNGTSLPHSPHSVEGAIGGAKMSPVDSDFEYTTRHPIFDYKGCYHDIAFSLCGKLHEHIDDPIPESLFMQTLVTYDDFCENPGVIDNPDLVVRVKGKFYNWASAAPLIMSLVLYQMPLPKKVMEMIVNENMPKKEIRKRTQSKGYTWFLWGRGQDTNKDPQTSQTGENGKMLLSSTSIESCDSNSKITSQSSSVASNLVTAMSAPVSLSNSTDLDNTSAGATYSSASAVNLGTSSILPREGELSSREDRERISREIIESSESDDQDDLSPKRRYKKTIRLTSDQISKLNLKNGINEVVFSVTTAYQGTTRCKCHIFLWNYDEKIVISDIDGTITKSDVLGHILPIIGKDWAQGGVAQLFTKIKNNGYNFLYLSARAIGQARITREYLRSVRQGDISLPDGPLLLNPTSLIQAFHREVIERKPEEFKISCLRDIKALFPENENPFYAGYGNRINDVWAYSAVGIPIQRIFTINHRGELKHELTQTFQTTYSNQSDIVNHMFPPANDREIQDEFSSFKYWRSPIPDITGEIDLVLSPISK